VSSQYTRISTIQQLQGKYSVSSCQSSKAISCLHPLSLPGMLTCEAGIEWLTCCATYFSDSPTNLMTFAIGPRA
jgi:hypothetical protein